MKRLLVGVDGSTGSESALRWAVQISQQTGAGIVAVHAYQRPFIEMTRGRHDRLVEERTTFLEGEWIRPSVDAGVAVETRLIEGDQRDVITSLTGNGSVDLAVLGRSGRGGEPGMAHLGSVVEHAAHHTRCPLAVIPSNVSLPVRLIAIGLDGSAESSTAVDWCAHFAADVGASVIALSVDEPVLEWTPSWDDQNWRRTVEHDLEAMVAPIRSHGVHVEVVAVRDFRPADGLLDVAAARGADLLVIGTRGAGGFSGLRVGGVAMKVLHKASLPLVLVPPPETS